MPKRKKNISNNTIPNSILFTAKILQSISKKLTIKFAQKLFSTPIRYKIPKRELIMDANTQQELVSIPKINKKIMVYQYGTSAKKVLLVHGWSGRGTQLVKIADKLLEMGFSTISFDAPAHGKSPGKTTSMLEFIGSILELEKKYGKFEFAIGHSLGGMSILNSIKKGLNVKKAVIIGSGDSVNDIVIDFITKLGLKLEIVPLLRKSYEDKYQESMEAYSGAVAAKEVLIPMLVIHDKQDEDVPYSASENIHKHLKNSKLIFTEKLGHRKILGDTVVISKIGEFLKS